MSGQEKRWCGLGGSNTYPHASNRTFPEAGLKKVLIPAFAITRRCGLLSVSAPFSHHRGYLLADIGDWPVKASISTIDIVASRIESESR